MGKRRNKAQSKPRSSKFSPRTTLGSQNLGTLDESFESPPVEKVISNQNKLTIASIFKSKKRGDSPWSPQDKYYKGDHLPSFAEWKKNREKRKKEAAKQERKTKSSTLEEKEDIYKLPGSSEDERENNPPPNSFQNMKKKEPEKLCSSATIKDKISLIMKDWEVSQGQSFKALREGMEVIQRANDICILSMEEAILKNKKCLHKFCLPCLEKMIEAPNKNCLSCLKTVPILQDMLNNM